MGHGYEWDMDTNGTWIRMGHGYKWGVLVKKMKVIISWILCESSMRVTY
jgi:hypothetical protein